MGGRELAEHVLRVLPGTKVLYASGYTDDVMLQHQIIERDVALVQKPCTLVRNRCTHRLLELFKEFWNEP